MPFKNRSDAGRKLAKALASYKEQQPVILALPRGGVTVAVEIAAALNAPLDLILSAQNRRTLSTRAGHGSRGGRRCTDHRAQ